MRATSSRPSSAIPKLTRAFLRFNIHLLLRSTLPPRLRELAVLRVAHLHALRVRVGRTTSRWASEDGLTDDEIDGVQRGEAADEFDRAILAAVDELEEKYEHLRRDLGRAAASASTSGSAWTSSSQSAAIGTLAMA